jgi:DNA-binding PadR family transcriptional regulator
VSTDLGRFAEPALLILISLAGGDKHGYAIMEDVAAFAGTRLGPGTLYGALARLERDGLIEVMASDERRRPYRLTNSGAAQLQARVGTLGQLARAGAERLAAS